MIKSERMKHFIKILLLAIVLAFLCEFFSNVNFYRIFDDIENDYNRIIVTPSELRLEDAEILPDGKIACYADPKMFLEDMDYYVHGVIIRYHGLSSEGLKARVYYDTGEGFTEEECVVSEITENKKSQFVEIRKKIKAMRIDIGYDGEDSYYLEGLIINPKVKDYVRSALENSSLIRCILYFMLIFTVLFCMDDFAFAKEVFFKYRYGIGAFAIVAFTLMKLHGSSIGFLSSALSGFDISRLFGTPRPIRSDEYVVFSEMAFSQVKSGFKWFSDIWGYSPSDMFMVYGQPVANIVSLFRPFSFPYLFLGAEYGLAFYWSSRLVVLLLISFDFGRLITKDERGLSLAYAVLVCLSPVVQWWYSTNCLVEMLVYGQGAILLTALYIKEKALYKKILYIAGMVICAGGYVLTLYPAWMIPLFYIFVICEINVVLDNKEDIHLGKMDFALLAGGILTVAVSLLYVFRTSSDTIDKIMNTVYPGNRIYAGGRLPHVFYLMRGWASWVWTFTDLMNPCEIVDFICFFPLGIIISVFALIKKRDRWLISLGILNAFLILYEVLPFPAIVAKVTLLSYSTQHLQIVIGFLNLIILFRGLVLAPPSGKLTKWLFSAALIAAVLSLYENKVALMPFQRWMIVLVALLFAGLLAYQHRPYVRNTFIAGALAISFIGGALVNPVSSGLDSIYHTRLLKAIERINEDEGLWVVCADSVAQANIPAIAGAHTLSALATYPDIEFWEKLGLGDEENEQIWNRYAHMRINISDKTEISLQQDDFINLMITIEDLQKLGTKYILSKGLLDSDKLTPLYQDEVYMIYELSAER